VEAAHIFPSFLARDIRDGRLGVPVNRYYRTARGGDATHSIARFGPAASIHLHTQWHQQSSKDLELLNREKAKTSMMILGGGPDREVKPACHCERTTLTSV
jgi:hypothetical protein